MFGIFKSKKYHEPLDPQWRKYFEHNLLWLEEQFPEPGLTDRKVLLPTNEHFPISWNGTEESAHEALKIICVNMQIEPNNVELGFFDNVIKEIDMGSSVMFLQNDPRNKEAAGVYHHLNENGKFSISLESGNLKNPANLIATIAHELAHVKLLGEKELDFNDEHLTDLATVFFGFGIFNANAAFNFFQGYDRWGYNSTGYLNQEQWAYTLALLAFIRKEDNPEWSTYLNASIKKDFKRSLKYLNDNEKSIFQFEDE